MYVLMEKIMRPVGLYMTQQQRRGPSFALFEFSEDKPLEQLLQMLRAAIQAYPAIDKLAVALQKLE